ncbi:hypothetical protein [Haladaptatus halobius]|uniref:hypothetical protein n=1 Tax=Haladaptatus halobius TaxID=2884875 RepID=UPI001D0B0522|nr:hypothetical protein [Haladaptatus halobius]
MIGDALACTCPHHVHRSAFCKYTAAVETATSDGSLEAFPLEDEDDAGAVVLSGGHGSGGSRA